MSSPSARRRSDRIEAPAVPARRRLLPRCCSWPLDPIKPARPSPVWLAAWQRRARSEQRPLEPNGGRSPSPYEQTRACESRDGPSSASGLATNSGLRLTSHGSAVIIVAILRRSHAAHMPSVCRSPAAHMPMFGRTFTSLGHTWPDVDQITSMFANLGPPGFEQLGSHARGRSPLPMLYQIWSTSARFCFSQVCARVGVRGARADGNPRCACPPTLRLEVRRVRL